MRTTGSLRRRDLLEGLFSDLRERRLAGGRSARGFAEKAGFIAASRHPVQAAVAADRHLRVAVRCARRAGKSWLALSIALERALLRSGSSWVIIGLTRPSVKRIYWRLLLGIDAAMELGGHPQHTELIYNLPNGSLIYFTGAETRSEMEKLRGAAYDGAILDESKSFGPVVFRELVEDVLEPALLDRRGQLILIGTPGSVLAGPFYEATAVPSAVMPDEVTRLNRWTSHRGQPTDQAGQDFPFVWSLHTWTLEDNPWRPGPGEPSLWEKALEKKARSQWDDHHPTWRREYLGEWVPDDTHLVYRYRPDWHDYTPSGDGPWGIPSDAPAGSWHLVQGIDLGYRDPTAVVVWAYSDLDPNVWEVHSEKRAEQAPHQVVEWLGQLDQQLGREPDVRVADPAGAQQVIAEIAFRGFPLQPAEKREKLDFVELFNSDLDERRVRIRRGSALSKELLTNRWLERTLGTPHKKEDPATPNDACDAGLYGWRRALHRRYVTPAARAAERSREWWATWRAEQLEDMRRRARDLAAGLDAYSAASAAQLDRNWWEDNP